MADNRPPIPRELERQILVEAGHRCAIPTCRQIPVDIHHIEPWSKVKEHAFENLIALCSNDHRRADKGEIDRKALRMYKANLGLVVGRYGDLERRVLDAFIEEPQSDFVRLPTELAVLMNYLVRDGIVDLRVPANEQSVERFPSYREYWITDIGREFIARYAEGKAIE